MERLLEHEERYWLWSSEVSQLSWLSPEARRQSVAELCLTGADSVADIAEVLKRVPDLSEKDVGKRRDVARWLGGLYPAVKRNLVSSLQPAEIMRRQKILLELSRASQVPQRPLNNEAPTERDIVEALQRQRKALSSIGDMAAMDMVIGAIKQIESPKSPDREEVS